MRATDIELALVKLLDYRQNLIIPNVSWGFIGLHYEADLIVVTKSGYAKEIEIKVSKGDLIKDKEKRHSHNCRKFKELYFAIPKKLLIDKEHIPERAGIYVIDEFDGDYIAVLERPALRTTAEPITTKDRSELARLGALRIWGLKGKINELQKQIKEML